MIPLNLFFKIVTIITAVQSCLKTLIIKIPAEIQQISISALKLACSAHTIYSTNSVSPEFRPQSSSAIFLRAGKSEPHARMHVRLINPTAAPGQMNAVPADADALRAGVQIATRASGDGHTSDR